MIARTDYDEPTTTGWLLGWRPLHVEVSRYHLHVRIGTLTLTLTRGDVIDRSEWEARR